jgi:methyl-accepting chemotaxis protein
MKKIIIYFTKNSQSEPYIIQTKAKALTVLTFIAFAIVFIKMGINIISVEDGKGAFANYGVPSMLGIVAFINLIMLRHTTYKTSGMFFSTGLMLTLLTGILMSANTIHPLMTYVNGFYILLALLALSALFGNKKSLIINFLITVAGVIYLHQSSLDLYQGEYAILAKGGMINYIISLVITVLILYFIMKISEDAQLKTIEMALETEANSKEIRENYVQLQNQESNLKSAISDTNFVISEAVDSGNFNARIDLSNKDGEWRLLGESINRLFASITIPFNSINRIVNKMANGDLTGRYEEDAKGNVLILKENLNTALDHLNKILREMADSVTHIGSSSDEMMVTNERMSEITSEITSAITEMNMGAQNQVNRVSESSTLIESISNLSSDIGGQATSINDTAKNGVKKSINGMQQSLLVTDTMKTILQFSTSTNTSVDSLSKRSEEISRVVNIIQEVAAQTNLLALNAAIEAAQAGDAGRGFAVVAEEIRKLAEDSKNSTREIEGLIGDIQKDTKQTASLISEMSERIQNGEKSAQQGNEAFEEIAESSKQTLDLSKKIVGDTDQQARDIKNIVSMVENVVVIAEQTAAGTDQATGSSEQLSTSMENYTINIKQVKEIIEELQNKVGQFKLDDKTPDEHSLNGDIPIIEK